MKKKFIIAGIVVLLLSAGFTTIGNRDFDIVKNLDIYCTLFRELNMFYVDEVDPDKLVETSIESMLSSLDPYTTYIPESEMDDFNFQTTGEYGGIGALIRKSGDYAIIAEPYENFPAANGGLRAGDKLLEIEGKSLKGMDISKVSELLKGEPKTELHIVYERPGSDSKSRVTLIREQIVIPNVPYFGMADKHTGYIRLSNFTTGASTEVKSALLELKKNPELRGIILDLRGNPGGLLIEAVRVSNLFVDKGEVIVSTKGKVKQWDSEYTTTQYPVDKDIPLVVLVNRGSASASEIVAGALQDLDRAVVVGQRTFGKGLVQTTRKLSYNTQLKVTTAKYYIPSGRCIQALDYTHRNEDGSVGVIPDSLISAFKTKNGRTVYDGGGILPDFSVVPDPYSDIALHLYAENVLFDYATLYASQNPDILPADQFSLNDEEYGNFSDFVLNRGFEYETSSEEELDKLVARAKQDKYYDGAEQEFAALRDKLSHNISRDLVTFKPDILSLLNQEIASRYYFEEGRILSQLQHDVQLEKAMDLLNTPDEVLLTLKESGTVGSQPIQ